MSQTGIVLVVEAGDLEQKATLLVESLVRFGQLPAHTTLFAVNPRKGKRLAPRTHELLDAHGVQYLEVPLNRDYIFYPLANKIVAAAHIESAYPDYHRLAFLDSDLLITGPVTDLFNRSQAVTVKPEEKINVGLPANQPPNLFWEMIYEHCGIDNWEEVWTVVSASEGVEMQALFNPSVLVKNTGRPLYGQWRENFVKVMRDKRLFKINYLEFYFIELAVFSATAVKMFGRQDFYLLDHQDNYPMHLHQDIDSGKMDLQRMNVLHYHNGLRNNDWLEEAVLSKEMQAWLLPKLPQQRLDRGILQRIKEISAFQWHKLKYKY